jgi:hypothetical protein
MKSSSKSGMIGFAVGLAVAAAGSQAAAQVTQHEHPTSPAQQPAPNAMSGMDKMKDMDAMMADPAMRQKMMADMAHCRDMMSMMMEHMKHEGKLGDAEPTPHKH